MNPKILNQSVGPGIAFNTIAMIPIIENEYLVLKLC